MNSIINHLGRAVTSVDDMVNVFDSFAMNNNWFTPVSQAYSRNSRYFVALPSGIYTGYVYTQSENNSVAWVKVNYDTTNSSSHRCTVTKIFYEDRKGEELTEDAHPVGFAYGSGTNTFGVSWAYLDYETSPSYVIDGVFFKIS